MPHLSLSRRLNVWLAVGCFAASIFTVADAEYIGVQLPFELNFEAEAGYQPGPLFFDQWWQFPESLLVQINDFGSVGEQSLSFLGQGLLSLRPVGSPTSAITWVDFLSKPVYVEAGDLPHSIIRERSTLTGFVKIDGQGEVYAVDGDGFGSGDWIASGSKASLDGDTSAQWLRFTYRLDYGKKTWDLFVDGKLVLADLGFLDNTIDRFTEFAVGSAEDAPTSIDYFYAGGLNPMYEDFSNDGIPDTWLISQGMSIYVNQRYGDHDNDGLNNLLEYMLGTRADNPDTDGDGLSDGVEYLLGYSPRVSESHALSPLPFHDNFESYGADVSLAQNGWSIVGDEVAIRQEDAFAGNAALSVGEGIVWNRFRGTGDPVVWMDIQVKPTFSRETPEVAEYVGVVYYFDANGRIVAFDGSGDGSGLWMALDGPVANGWRRVTVKADYQAQSYDVYVNGERLGVGLGFAYRQPFMSKFEARGLTLPDDVSISAVEPSGLDDDRDGIDNATELLFGTNPNAFDTDGDGLSDALEILWGLDPLVADTYLAVPTETAPGVFYWSTSFATAEGYQGGALAGQNGWGAAGATEVSVEEDATLTQLAEADSSFERLFGVGENRRVWITFDAKLLTGPMPEVTTLTQPAVALMGFTDSKTLVVWDEVSNEWKTHPVVADPMEWNGDTASSKEWGSALDRQQANTKDEGSTGLLNEGFRYHDLETTTITKKVAHLKWAKL